MQDKITEIYNTLLDNGIDVPLNQIKESLEKMIDLGLQESQASKLVAQNIARKHGIELKASQQQQNNPLKTVEAVLNNDNVSAGDWIALKITVTQIQDGEKYHQRGIIGDETGTLSITAFNNTPFTLEEGKSYQLENVVVNEWQGQMQITANKTSKATLLDEVIEAKPFVATVTGKIVAIQNGSGLIKRCPECNKALSKGACMKHGKVDGIYDIRIKAVLDNGTETNNLLFQTKETENIAGFDLQTAIAMAADALDQAVVGDTIKKLICNRYYEVQATPLGTQMLVSEIKSLAGPLHNPLEAKPLL
jgi:replication factor A1